MRIGRPSAAFGGACAETRAGMAGQVLGVATHLQLAAVPPREDADEGPARRVESLDDLRSVALRRGGIQHELGHPSRLEEEVVEPWLGLGFGLGLGLGIGIGLGLGLGLGSGLGLGLGPEVRFRVRA